MAAVCRGYLGGWGKSEFLMVVGGVLAPIVVSPLGAGRALHCSVALRVVIWGLLAKIDCGYATAEFWSLHSAPHELWGV